jgi:hypothetical protein
MRVTINVAAAHDLVAWPATVLAARRELIDEPPDRSFDMCAIATWRRPAATKS